MDAEPGLSFDNSSGIPSPQIAFINYFFPGYSFILSTVNSSLGGDLNRYLPYIVVALAARFLWGYANDNIGGWVENYFMSSFVVRAEDETYNLLMLWTTKQAFAQKTRNFVVNTDLYSRNGQTWREEDSDDEDDCIGGDTPDGTGPGQKHTLHYTPSMGQHWFWYKRHLLRFERCEGKSNGAIRTGVEAEELRISCFGRDPHILKELLREARSLYIQKDERKTIIYRATTSVSSYGADSYWTRCMSRPNRPFSTVILPEKTKDELIADAGDYLDARTRRWYANRGIPYRRGYLLYGPPGTGKSSLSLALAGYFRMKIYILSLSSTTLTEENLADLFNDLPNNCVVLLEDIDTAGLTSTRDPSAYSNSTNDSNNSSQNNDSNNSTSAQGQVSLSGLLNVLDGVAAKEGRVLIMTTNHVEKLDKALIRPGRIDMMVPFELADAEMCEAIFKAIYTPYDGEVEHNSDEATDAADEKRRLSQRYSDAKDKVDVLAKEFAAKVPEKEFSPAQLQGLLLRHKRDPAAAVADVESWVDQIRLEQKEKKAAEAEKKKKEVEEKKKMEEEEEEKKKKDEEEKQKKEEEENQKGEETKSKAEEQDSKEESVDDQKTPTESETKESSSQEKVESKDASSGLTVDETKKTGTSDSGYDTQ